MLILSAVSTCLVFLLVRGLNISQPQGQVEAEEGSNVTLVCTMTSATPVGPVRWYKGADSERTHFYSGSPKGGDKNDPRVSWTMENPTVNYSITVRDVRVNDTGEYYCVKYTKADEEKPYASGPGVNLIVKGVPIITGPASRVKVGNDLELTCEVNGVSDITVKWFKDEQEVTPEHRDTSWGGKSRRSVIRLTPKIQDIKSVVRCQELGLSALNPLEDKFHLKDAIAVLPGVPVIENPKLVLGDSVIMTCKLSGIYPRDINVTWTWDKTFKSSQSQHAEEHENGTFTVTSVLSFTVKEDMRGTQLTCQAGYEGLTPVSATVTLGVRGFIVSQPQGRVEALERSNVTLVCVMSSESPPGPVRWYKGNGSERTHFCSGAPKGGDKNDSRVTWTAEYMTVNYSITIRDLRVSDTGEYYCEKYRKKDENKTYASGPGVTLTVRGTGPSNSTNQNTDGHSGKIAAGVLSAIIIIVCIVGVTIWYFRKKAKGNSTISKSSSSNDGSTSPVDSKEVEVTYAELDSKNFQSRQKKPKENEEDQSSTPEMPESVVYASLQQNKGTSKSSQKTKRAQEAMLYY
ncbi:signal-regulatory protein beta-1-like isoform X1 [Erpetoichthys calabaricus]|uniref:signal-regulatory protein beta-1-like isoform X1 n=1 Tax=Erpetoichthys calabaricus TaxID=27687 RepID=UPI002234C6BA|nr:signal-regulatory protein beta-1-like isoform X1 [Erpetoichthys calabaricus]